MSIYMRACDRLTCAVCGKPFFGKLGFHKHCSPQCAKIKMAADKRARDQRRIEKRRAYDRAYRAAGKRIAQPYGYWPSQWIEIVEAMGRIDARRQARDRHADIMEAARQMDRMRWHIYGSGVAKQLNKGWVNRKAIWMSPDEVAERKRLRSRENNRNERLALKMYREMGFSASRKDRREIYRALKAELPTLNI